MFDEVEISKDEPEWSDYDEKASPATPRSATPTDLSSRQAGAGVSIMEIETRISRA